MDGLFTVFGLGTAFGVFCSWMYDVIRKRNLPVSRGTSFEAFHGSDVMPAPEPVVSARTSEPVLDPERVPVASAKPVDLSLVGPYSVSEPKTPARVEPLAPLASLAPSTPLNVPRPVVVPVVAAPGASSAPAPIASAPVVSTSVVSAPVVITKPAAPVVNAPVVNVKGPAIAPMKETVVMGKSPAIKAGIDAKPTADAVAKPVVETKDAPVVAKPLESKAPAAAEDVVFTQADGLDVNFDVADVSFSDTVSFEPTDFELPVQPRAPRVVLLVNNTVVRDVQENDLLGLMLEFGIMADSEEAGNFQRGDSVTVGRNSVQLVQV